MLPSLRPSHVTAVIVTLFPIRLSVDPTLLSVTQTFLGGPRPSVLANKMEKVASKKKTQRLKLAMRIEETKRRVRACGRCLSRRRSCILDPSLSSRCSECVRSKCACSSDGVIFQPRQGLPCRFFFGPRAKSVPVVVASLVTPPRSESPQPVMDLDFFLEEWERDVGFRDVPVEGSPGGDFSAALNDPNSSFWFPEWDDPGAVGGTPSALQGS